MSSLRAYLQLIATNKHYWLYVNRLFVTKLLIYTAAQVTKNPGVALTWGYWGKLTEPNLLLYVLDDILMTTNLHMIV